MLVILLPPAAVFIYVLQDLHRTHRPAPPEPVQARVAAAPEAAGSPAWQSPFSAAA